MCCGESTLPLHNDFMMVSVNIYLLLPVRIPWYIKHNLPNFNFNFFENILFKKGGVSLNPILLWYKMKRLSSF